MTARKRRNIKPKQRIIFFVEGETEEAFFNTLAQKHRLTAAKTVSIMSCQGTDWVEKAKSKMQKDPNLRPDDKTTVYIIFDKDNVSQNEMQQMQSKVKKINSSGIKCQLGVSNRSFETWLLAHYELLNANRMSQSQLEKRLSGYLKEPYKKANSRQIESILSNDKVYNAIENSQAVTPFNYDLQSTDIGAIVDKVIK